jgi:hypothetical protein
MRAVKESSRRDIERVPAGNVTSIFARHDPVNIAA